MFTSKDVASYYNTTQNHYESWWNLKKELSLHYGIWEEGINSFSESLMNTNRILMELAQITAAEKVLDAGCGVGGAAFYISKNANAKVDGITLSEKQVNLANEIKKEKQDGNVNFHLMDYTETTFPPESFDVIWGCESISSAPDKAKFIKEAFRLLKKGGRLIVSDYFLQNLEQNQDPVIKKWIETWSISNLASRDSFMNSITETGFESVQNHNYSKQIKKSVKRMYYASLLGAIPSELYNLFHPKVSRFAKTHYKGGYYQYQAFQKGLWDYQIIVAVK